MQTGYEEGVYDAQEAKTKIKGYQAGILAVENEIKRLSNKNAEDDGVGSIEALKRQLVRIRRANLALAGFKDKLNIIGFLKVRVYPSEDVKAMKIKLGLESHQDEITGDKNACGKVLYAPPL